ncbi:MAG: hypothetical protein HZC22_15230 [Rhodocyclales bacterium]|nr:hypothetical protein [Rhodocyclales bacterium]
MIGTRFWRSLPIGVACSMTACLACAAGTWTPYPLPTGGPQVKAHYVHLELSIDAEHQARLRQQIQDTYQACKLGKDGERSVGKDPGPLAPPPPRGAPDKVKTGDVEIYYSAGRSVAILTGSIFRINLVEDGEGSSSERSRRADCSLREFKTQFLYVRPGTGVCQVDLLKGKYTSKNCPWTKTAPDHAPGIRQRNMTPGDQGGPPETMSRATGQRRTIAGHECDVIDIANGMFERCFALPPSSFPIPAAHHAGRQPGLLLQQKWPAVGETLTAKEVRLEVDVSAAIFDPPPGLRLESTRLERKRK